MNNLTNSAHRTTTTHTATLSTIAHRLHLLTDLTGLTAFERAFTARLRDYGDLGLISDCEVVVLSHIWQRHKHKPLEKPLEVLTVRTSGMTTLNVGHHGKDQVFLSLTQGEWWIWADREATQFVGSIAEHGAEHCRWYSARLRGDRPYRMEGILSRNGAVRSLYLNWLHTGGHDGTAST